MIRLDFRNSTALSDERLLALCRRAIAGWRVGRLSVRIRYSRGADFSGSCYYADRRIFVNLGRHLVYPYQMGTHLARAKTIGRSWSKAIYTIELASAYEVVLFVFLHELYHMLIKLAGRNTRQKESMCDRFAARFLVDVCGATVRAEEGQPVPRSQWDFQAVERFVAAVRDRRQTRTSPRLIAPRAAMPRQEQLLLFPL